MSNYPDNIHMYDWHPSSPFYEGDDGVEEVNDEKKPLMLTAARLQEMQDNIRFYKCLNASLVQELLEEYLNVRGALDAACEYLDISGDSAPDGHNWQQWWLICADECRCKELP
jgi:hypothetical protein